LYLITFENSDIVFHYKRENVQIIKNIIASDKNSVFEYLKNIACLSEIKNDRGENILSKNYDKAAFINDSSALSVYLNPQKNFAKYEVAHPIFPFGCNNSQFKAVSNALENQFSIIQGPPGTGKTQTILNIISNLLLTNKTILVVSNNNSAIENIHEKLSSSKYNLGFIVAPLGKSENISKFLENQSEKYPEEMYDWKSGSCIFSSYLSSSFEKLKKLFEYQEKEASLKQELDSLKIEYKHFSLERIDNENLSSKKVNNFTSEQIMELWQKVQYKIIEKEKLGFFSKLSLFLKYRIGTLHFWQLKENELIAFFKNIFYQKRIDELESEIATNEKLKSEFDSETLYTQALSFLKYKIFERYCKNKTRNIFTERDLNNESAGFFEEYPVVLSTTFSSRSCLPYFSKGFLFDYLIMDESSQVDVSTGALALSCAKNVVIVGDKKQLPNVITSLDKIRAQQIFSEYKISPAYDFSKHSFLSSVEKLIPNIPQTLLREHYRCHPKIINFCNQKFYDNQLLIMTADNNEKDVLRVFKTNEGNHCREHKNQRQVDVIVQDILPTLLDTNKDEIGIIAPYREQTNLISKEVPDIQSDTVHKFQGREKDVIIISTTDDKITDFSDDANLLNVAISRAKKNLYIVVSGNELPKNKNLTDLISYIQYNNCEITQSNVHSVFDYLYSQYTAKRFEYLAKSKKISRYDSENLMYKLISEILNCAEYKNLGVLFEQPLKEIVNVSHFENISEEEKQYANNDFTHIDFAIYNKITKKVILAIEVDGYKYHKKGTRQAQRDKMKNHILEVCSIPLLRFSTTGSGEKEKIISQLNELQK